MPGTAVPLIGISAGVTGGVTGGVVGGETGGLVGSPPQDARTARQAIENAPTVIDRAPAVRERLMTYLCRRRP